MISGRMEAAWASFSGEHFARFGFSCRGDCPTDMVLNEGAGPLADAASARRSVADAGKPTRMLRSPGPRRAPASDPGAISHAGDHRGPASDTLSAAKVLPVGVAIQERSRDSALPAPSRVVAVRLFWHQFSSQLSQHDVGAATTPISRCLGGDRSLLDPDGTARVVVHRRTAPSGGNGARVGCAWRDGTMRTGTGVRPCSVVRARSRRQASRGRESALWNGEDFA